MSGWMSSNVGFSNWEDLVTSASLSYLRRVTHLQLRVMLLGQLDREDGQTPHFRFSMFLKVRSK